MGVVMPLFRRTKAAPKLSNPVNPEIWGDTLKQSEQLARHYGNNPEAHELLARAFGEAAICARINAKICDSATLRLYRRATKTEKVRHRTAVKQADARGYKGASRDSFIEAKSGVRMVSATKRKAMQQGQYGRKLAEFTLGGAEMVEVISHPALDLARNPNWLFPGNEINLTGWTFRWLVGNSYEFASFTGSTPTQLYPMYAQHVNIVANDETGIEAYVYGRAETSWHPYSPNEVIHYKLWPSLHSPLYGVCPLHDVLPYVDQLRDSVILDIAMTKNGLRPDMLVNLPEGTPDKERDSFLKRLKNRHRGVGRWNEPLVTTGETKVQPLTWPEKEAMSLPKREEASKMVRRAYGHDESQADSSDATYAAALMGDARFLGQTIEPALQQDAAQKVKLLQWFGLDTDEYGFAYDPMVEKDEAVYGERLRADWQAGLRTANEVRVELGLEEIDDENANKLMVNGQPLGATGGGLFGGFDFGTTTDPEPSPPGSADDKPDQPQATPAATGTPDQPEGSVPIDGVDQPAKIEETALNGAQIDKLVEVALKISSGELPKEAGRAIILAAFPGIPPQKIEAIFAELVEGSAEPEGVADPDIAKCAKAYRIKSSFKSILQTHESPLWRDCDECRRTKDDDDDLRAYDAKLRDAIQRYQGQVATVARDVIEDMQSEAVEAIGNGRTPNLAPIVEQAAPEFADAMSEIVRLGVTNILESGQFGGSVPDEAFNIAPERALQSLETYSFELAGELADTTVKMTETAVRNGLEQGLSIADIAAEMEGFPEYRAEAIARTETNRAYNAGHREGAKAVGVEEYRIITAPGVRKSHAAIAARGWTPMDDPIVKAGEVIEGETFTRDLHAPPLGVNCRCSIAFKFEGE